MKPATLNNALVDQAKYRENIHKGLNRFGGTDENPITIDKWGEGDLRNVGQMDKETETTLAAIDRDGFAIIPKVITPDECDAIRSTLEGIEQKTGRNRCGALLFGLFSS
jgi:hypothetical protein